MSRIASFAYGIASYALFLACFLYSIAFIGNFDLGVLPSTIDSGVPGTLGVALGIDLVLLSIFALQHSVMARPGFKRAWTRFVPQQLERATYVLLSTAALALLYWGWEPIGGSVWNVEGATGRGLLTGLYFAGWGLVLYATILIDHFDLFGVRQVWLHLRGQAYAHRPFMTPSLYRHVRHPLYVGWFTVFWATPSMSVGHLLFAGVASAYILVAVIVEERDLVSHFGDVYRRYQESTPRFLPSLRAAAARPSAGRSAGVHQP
jgi:protein-S-isoprenylcysteine O-methyltransferase Ste14